MSAIYIKELKSFFKSLFGWIFLAAFTFFAGVFFVLTNISPATGLGSPYIADSLGSLVTVLVFIVPIITMRVLSEEKRQKTDQLLLTSPVALWKIIVGKFLAMATVMLIATLIACVGIIVIAIYGTVPVSDTILSVIMFYALACNLVAIGIFVSSITEYQILAGFLSVFINVFILFVPALIYNVLGEGPLVNVASYLYIYRPFSVGSSGILDIADVIYTISVTVIFLILAYKVFSKNSVQVSAVGRNKYFISNLIPFAVIVAIIAFNVGLIFVPTKFTQFDCTYNKIYSISKTSKAILKENTEDVTIFVFASKESVDQRIKFYLNEYERASDKIKIVYKDGIYEKDPSSLTIKVGDKSKDIDYSDLYEWETYYYQSYISGFDIENEITSAIVSLKDETANITIPSKSLQYDNVIVKSEMIIFYAAMFCLVAPVVLLVVGIMAVVFRKKIVALLSRG